MQNAIQLMFQALFQLEFRLKRLLWAFSSKLTAMQMVMKSKTPEKRLIRILPRYLQSTADNSNLQGKSKKVRVTGSSKLILEKRNWDGGGMQISCSLHFKGSKIYTAILKKELNNKA